MGLEEKKPTIRFLDELKNVLYDEGWANSAPNFEVYYMYRNLKEKDGLRYDITVIPSKILGGEFVKTKGHEHVGSFSEIYLVLEGEAIYLIQKREGDKIKDVAAIRAKKGDVIIIPPYYGHVTINPSNEKLKMANWLAEDCKSDYTYFEKKRGACYYLTQFGWLKNKNYKKVPKLRFEKPLQKLPEDWENILKKENGLNFGKNAKV